tara:strand:+ start:785 stop:1246 length:462 start_codon:yes stop_codon:yes gene_type:complete
MSTIFANNLKNISGGNNVKVNQLSGIDTAGSILVTGEGNNITTNLQQGLIKAWMNLNGSGTIDGMVGVRDSFNVSGVVDNGNGNYTKSLTNNMAATHSSGTAGSACSNTAYADRSVSVLATATSSFQVNTGQDYTVNRANSLYTQTLAAGDLA